MTIFDRLLQRWRIAKARPFIQPGSRVLDIGCADSALLRFVPGIRSYVGIDPVLRPAPAHDGATLLTGAFPRERPPGLFDVVTCLAVFEHVPDAAHESFARTCFDALEPGGVLVLTIPDPFVDRILDVLESLKLIDGIEIHQHHGFEVERTPIIFADVGFHLAERKRFQLGLNNLFVFRRPLRESRASAGA